MGAEGEYDKLTILVLKEKKTKMSMATVVPSKSTGTFVRARCRAFLEELGLESVDVIAKSDQEPAIKAIAHEIAQEKAHGRWVVEASPVGSSQSNDVVEREAQSVEGQTRTMNIAFEDRLGLIIPTLHPVMPWMVENAAHLWSRCNVGLGGKTGYERSKGKPAKVNGLEFKELVLWRKKREGGHLAKLSSLWNDGIYLDAKGKTNEYIIGDRNGVWKTRTVCRRPKEERWLGELNLSMVVGAPWNASKTTPTLAERGHRSSDLRKRTFRVTRR